MTVQRDLAGAAAGAAGGSNQAWEPREAGGQWLSRLNACLGAMSISGQPSHLPNRGRSSRKHFDWDENERLSQSLEQSPMRDGRLQIYLQSRFTRTTFSFEVF